MLQPGSLVSICRRIRTLKQVCATVSKSIQNHLTAEPGNPDLPIASILNAVKNERFNVKDGNSVNDHNAKRKPSGG